MTETIDSRMTRWLAAALLSGLSAVPAAGANPPARGSLAGKDFDKHTETLVPNVTIDAVALTSGEAFRTVTGSDGSYIVDSAPTGVYSFTLNAGGTDYVVQERLDVRVGMPFLLESCFDLDGESRTAHVRDACDSGLAEPARVATIGPHRFLISQDFPGQTPELDADPVESQDVIAPTPIQEPLADMETEQADADSDAAAEAAATMPESIEHQELECLTYEHFPLVDAVIAPGDRIEISRVYFRSDKYPDFYYVDMGPEHPTIDDFQAILPKPSPETERIYYYVESVDANFDSLQTPEFDPEVLDVQECEDRGATWFQGDDPGIVVGATTAGVAAIPPGFQAVGITGFVSSLGVVSGVGAAAAAGGGVASGTGLVLVVAGSAAAAAGTTVAIAGDEASPP